jgi:hypothetical protein
MSSRKRNASPLQSDDSGSEEGESSKRMRGQLRQGESAAGQGDPNEPQPVSLGNVVTPATSQQRLVLGDDAAAQNVRRALFSTPRPVPVTPAPSKQKESDPPSAKRKLIFGRLVDEILVKETTRQVYTIVRKLTGSIGGNACHGPIYGELTMGSMQKMINLMKQHTKFDKESRFIDVGSGIGKPNLHVAQDPGVELSYGIEVDCDRWLLGMNCLKGVLDAAHSQQVSNETIPDREKLLHRCIFEHADIRKANSFDPFTHVYMFSIG